MQVKESHDAVKDSKKVENDYVSNEDSSKFVWKKIHLSNNANKKVNRKKSDMNEIQFSVSSLPSNKDGQN